MPSFYLHSQLTPFLSNTHARLHTPPRGRKIIQLLNKKNHIFKPHTVQTQFKDPYCHTSRLSSAHQPWAVNVREDRAWMFTCHASLASFWTCLVLECLEIIARGQRTIFTHVCMYCVRPPCRDNTLWPLPLLPIFHTLKAFCSGKPQNISETSVNLTP